MPLSLGGNGVISGIDWAGTGGGLAHITTSSFSGASTVSVDGCFTSTYQNYLIKVTNFYGSADSTTTIKMRLSGTDNSAANYDSQYLGASSTTVAGSLASAQTSGNVGKHYTGLPNSFDLSIYQPAEATSTSWASFGLQANAPQVVIYVGRHTVGTAYDGFSLIPASGTITGTVRVYGYIND